MVLSLTHWVHSVDRNNVRWNGFWILRIVSTNKLEQIERRQAMGTNYYHTPHEPCSECHRPYTPRHIGKSSAGWCFALHIYPEEGIHTLEDWKIQLQSGIVHDEYDREIPTKEMLIIITKREWHSESSKPASWLLVNDAIPGPHGLVRCRIDGVHCVAHEEGTWDYFVGEFS